MKKLGFLLLFISLNGLASKLASYQEFRRMPKAQQIQVIDAYRTFFHIYMQNEIPADLAFLETNKKFLQLIESAQAASPFNCFYAGWPSVKKVVVVEGKAKTFCSSPLKANPQYATLASVCGANSLLCQPTLFGKNLCISVATQAERNSAFSRCEKKFTESGKSLTDVVNEMNDSQGDDLFLLVHEICSNGYQSNSSMCQNLKNKVSAVKNTLPIQTADKTIPVVMKNVAPKISPPTGKIPQSSGESKQVSIKHEATHANSLLQTKSSRDSLLNAKTSEANSNDKLKSEISSSLKVLETIQEPSLTSSQFVCNADPLADRDINQNQPTRDGFCNRLVDRHSNFEPYSTWTHNTPTKAVKIWNDYEKNISTGEISVIGLDIDVNQFGGQREGAATTPRRNYAYDSDATGKEATFSINDSVNGGSSRILVTEYTFFPRKKFPSAKPYGDDVALTLTTGEEVIIDGKTGQVKGGAAKDTPINAGQYPNRKFEYQGQGIYIETKMSASHHDKNPGNMVSVKGMVDGKVQECKLRSDDLWVSKSGHFLPDTAENRVSPEPGKKSPYEASKWSCTQLKYDKDEDFYKLIKEKCPGFKFPGLIQ